MDVNVVSTTTTLHVNDDQTWTFPTRDTHPPVTLPVRMVQVTHRSDCPDPYAVLITWPDGNPVMQSTDTVCRSDAPAWIADLIDAHPLPQDTP